MAENKNCEKCGNALREHAKFCPKCGHPVQNAENTGGILSFDDFFVDDTKHEKTHEAHDTPTVEDKTIDAVLPPNKEEQKSADKDKKKVFGFKEKDKRKKVKVLEDTLELPIEEIQREIEKRKHEPKNSEAQDNRKHMEGLYDRFRGKNDDVLIPESEIVKDEDKKEKKGLFSQAKSYLMGTDNEDIEGVDVKAEEEREERRARAARRRKQEAERLHPTREEKRIEDSKTEKDTVKETTPPIASEAKEKATTPDKKGAPKEKQDVAKKQAQVKDTPKKTEGGWKGFFGIQKEDQSPAVIAEEKAAKTNVDAAKDVKQEQKPAIASTDKQEQKTGVTPADKNKQNDKKDLEKEKTVAAAVQKSQQEPNKDKVQEKKQKDQKQKAAATANAQEEPKKQGGWFQSIFGDEVQEEPVVVTPPSGQTKTKNDKTKKDKTNQKSPQKGEKKPLTEAEKAKKKQTRNRILGIAAVLLLVIGTALFFTGNYVTDPMRLAESFEEVVVAKDANAIANMVNAQGTEVTAEKLGPFMTLLENEEYEAQLLENLKTVDIETGRTPDADVWIENAGKKYFFFDAYSLNMKTFSVTPNVTYADTQVYFDDEEPITVSPDTAQTITGILPGEHRLRTEYTKGLNPLTSEKTVDLQTANDTLVDNTATVDLANAGKFGSVTASQPEAELLINGTSVGKIKDLGADYRFGPFQEPVEAQMKLTTPLGTIDSGAQSVSDDGQKVEFTFPGMVQLPESLDEATLFVNGENTNLTGADWAPFNKMMGPLKPEDTIRAQMVIDGKSTLSNELTVGELEGEPSFSFTKTINFAWADSAARVILDGEDTGETVYGLAGDDMAAEILNSYETIAIEKDYPWGTFTSDTVEIGNGGDVRFSINSMNDRMVRQLQDAVVTYLEEDAFAVSNLKPNNYSNIENPLLAERQAMINAIIEEGTRVVRVSDQAHFDMSSVQYDDEGDEFWARISARYSYHYQEYMAGIFRPIRLEMSEASESYQFALRYDGDRGRWVIYEQRPQDGIGENTESFDLAY